MRKSGIALKYYKSFIGSVMKTTHDGLYPKGTFFLIKDVKRYKDISWTHRKTGYKFVIDILDINGNKIMDRNNICNLSTRPADILPYSKNVINLTGN
jgi:hypothetical protein